MKRLLFVLAAATMIVTGCSQGANVTNNTEPVTASQGPPTSVTDSQEHPGTIQDVLAGQYNRWYKITNEIVSKVGKKYEVVTFGIDHKGTISQGPGGVTSNVLPTGTPLYEIPGVDPAQAIAVPWNGVYYKAVQTGE